MMAKHPINRNASDISRTSTADYSNATASVCRRVLAIRKCQKESQTHFGKRFGFSQQAASDWETPKSNRPLPLEVAIQICNTWGLSLDYIYLGRPDGLTHSMLDKLDAAVNVKK